MQNSTSGALVLQQMFFVVEVMDRISLNFQPTTLNYARMLRISVATLSQAASVITGVRVLSNT